MNRNDSCSLFQRPTGSIQAKIPVKCFNWRKRKVEHSPQASLHSCLDVKFSEKIDTRKGFRIMVEEINVSQHTLAEKTCSVISNVLFPDECQRLISVAEMTGFLPALLDTGNGEVLMQKNRNLDQCTIIDKAFSDAIFQRISDVLPRTIRTPDGSLWKPLSLSERMRVLRYGPGHFISSHRDGAYCRNDSERTFLTVIIYLNDGKDDFIGGSTNFLSRNSPCSESKTFITSKVIPQRGAILVFDQNLLHEGAKLLVGHKYAIRTEVMYRRDQPISR